MHGGNEPPVEQQTLAPLGDYLVRPMVKFGKLKGGVYKIRVSEVINSDRTKSELGAYYFMFFPCFPRNPRHRTTLFLQKSIF